MAMQSSPPANGHESNDIELDDEEARLLGTSEARGADRCSPPTPHVPTHRISLWGRMQNPENPTRHTIEAIFPRLQESPVQFLASRKINTKIFHAAVLLIWLIAFLLLLTAQLPVRDGSVIDLDCVDTLWRRNNECGIDGIDCRPFNDRTIAFRCPAKCLDVKLLNPRKVGPIEVNYRPLVIGNGTYRGDSFVCASAIHAGVINQALGGCGRVMLVGTQYYFSSTKQHGIESISFDSSFPLSFAVAPDDTLQCRSDPRVALLVVSVVATTVLAIFSTSPLIFFPIFVLIFAHVAFVSDPPQASYRNTTVLPDHISMFAKRLLPAFFVAIVTYHRIIKRTLSDLTAHFEKAVLWLGGFWFGALSNYTFDWIPLSRLDAHDLNQQPGAKLALAAIILILVVIIVGQAYAFWGEGRLLRYLGLYSLFIAAILFCLAIPGVSLRIHHYILALLLLPGTSMQTRPSLLYQGILLGLFVNGIARWDFDSVLQTREALRGDAMLDSLVPKSLVPSIVADAEGLTTKFSWEAPTMQADGISVLINDVERGRIFHDDHKNWTNMQFEWTRSASDSLDEYFRWAYLKAGRTLDYSQAGTLFANGTWLSEWGY